MTVVRDLLTVLEHHVKTIDQLQKELAELNTDIRRLLLQNGEKTCQTAIESLLALIAYAKRPLGEKKTIPMLYLQVQNYGNGNSAAFCVMYKKNLDSRGAIA